VITPRSKPTVFAPSDALLHAESSLGSHARESLALAAPIPDSELGVFAYVWREGGFRWGRFVFVAGPDLTKPEFVDFSADDVHSGDDLRDFEVGGLRWRQPDPLHTAEISAMTATLDGTPAAAQIEFGWPQDYVHAITAPTF
jgi:hypothetical protein